MSIIDSTASAATSGDKQGLREVLDFLVTDQPSGQEVPEQRREGSRLVERDDVAAL